MSKTFKASLEHWMENHRKWKPPQYDGWPIWTYEQRSPPCSHTEELAHTLHFYTCVQWFNTQLFYIIDKIQSVVLVSCAFLYMAAWDRPGKRWYIFTEFDSLKMTIHVGIISSSFAINTHRYRHNMSQSYQPITFRFH